MTSRPAARDAAPLTRALVPARPAAPIRIVHLGLGAFHRAHQAWYTQHAVDAADWGIAAFTGRSPDAARMLASQDGLYTLIERGPDGDRAEIIGSISAAYDGADTARLTALLAAPTTAAVTLTVTEPGYRLRRDGLIDGADPEVIRDIAALRGTDPMPVTALGRLLAGLAARRRADAGPVAVVPCDNIPANGPLIRRAVHELALRVDAGLAAWVAEQVSFVSTSVDRITPRTTAADLASAAELTGFADAAPVVAEPFSDWVLCGDFPAGRPAWETAGVRFVADIEPFEQRKLWLLNGSHSLLAYLGTLRGHLTVADAIADPECLAAVREFWAEAAATLPEGLDIDAYCAALLDRFGNARIAHRLAQIGMEGATKLGPRIAPIAHAQLAAGRDARGCAAVLAAWIVLAQRGTLPTDARAADISHAVRAVDPVRALVAVVDPPLATGETFVRSVRTQVSALQNADRYPPALARH